MTFGSRNTESVDYAHAGYVSCVHIAYALRNLQATISAHEVPCIYRGGISEEDGLHEIELGTHTGSD